MFRKLFCLVVGHTDREFVASYGRVFDNGTEMWMGLFRCSCGKASDKLKEMESLFHV